MPDVTEGAFVTPAIRLVRRLGQGGMGAVWLAEHTTLRSHVVVKFMLGTTIDQAGVERFWREAVAASQVRSPHVVQVLDHGVTPGGLPFIVMEHLEGEDLGGRIARGGPVPPRALSEIVTQTCKALGRAHARGIIHRDIKPENIFLCDSEGDVFVKLLDFGIAKGRDDDFHATRTGTVMGSPYYMSPEQAVAAKNVDHRTDLWSLGVVVFQALTGTVPFEGETLSAIAIAIHSGAIPLPSQRNASLTPAIDAWFAKACARDMNARFSSAKELAVALAEAAGVAVPSLAASGSTPNVMLASATPTGPTFLNTPVPSPSSFAAGPPSSVEAWAVAPHASASSDAMSIPKVVAPKPILPTPVQLTSAPQDFEATEIALARADQPPAPSAPKSVGQTTAAPTSYAASGQRRVKIGALVAATLAAVALGAIGVVAIFRPKGAPQEEVAGDRGKEKDKDKDKKHATVPAAEDDETLSIETSAPSIATTIAPPIATSASAPIASVSAVPSASSAPSSTTTLPKPTFKPPVHPTSTTKHDAPIL